MAEERDKIEDKRSAGFGIKLTLMYTCENESLRWAKGQRQQPYSLAPTFTIRVFIIAEFVTSDMQRRNSSCFVYPISGAMYP